MGFTRSTNSIPQIPGNYFLCSVLRKKILNLKNKDMRTHPDLSNYENSVTSRFMILLTPEYHQATLMELLVVARNILDDPETSVSLHKKKEYLLHLERMNSKVQFQTYITNLSMKGCNLPLT